MINLILNAVTKQLGTKFGDSHHYYVENVEQGLIKPCFTVDTLMPTIRSKSAVLYDRTIPIVIHYFGDSKNDLKNKCYEMSEQIIECLEYLPFKNTLIRAENISNNMVEDVLQVFLTYKLTTVRDIDNEDHMETLDEKVAHE